MKMHRLLKMWAAGMGMTLIGACGPQPSEFAIQEATIAGIHQAMAEGRISARQLVELSLERIEAYDKQGPSINAIITLNPRALERADELDAAFARSGASGPLHGIPVIVKDNYDTADLPTSAGSLALKNSVPPDDAFQVRRLREAGAIVVAKSNMAEWAFSPYETVSSVLPGHTRNPYALNRVPAGSSGGTGAAVAASFGVVGLGTDTGNSIRGPSSHNALVGIRSTMGLTSRDGIVPLFLDHDIGGPMARTVADAAVVLEVIAGYDPSDPVTEAARGRSPERYSDALRPDGLKGARIGVMRQLANREGADAEVLDVFERAVEDLRSQGAVIVDNVTIPQLAHLASSSEEEPETFWCPRFRTDLEDYLASLGTSAPFATLQQIIDSELFYPNNASRLSLFQEQAPPEEHEGCRDSLINREALRQTVLGVFEDLGVDALVFPTWSNPPRLIGDLNSPHGDNSQHLAPHTGFPALSVPMGYVREDLPVGLQLLGRPFAEATLIRLAYAYEQATRHRHPPLATPALH